MSDWQQNSADSVLSGDSPHVQVPRRRLTSSVQSESLMGSYIASLYPQRFPNINESGSKHHHQQQQHHHNRNLQQPPQQQQRQQRQPSSVYESAEMITDSLLLQVPEGTSWWAGVIIMANCTIGMGLLNFPRAVANAGGIVNALIIQFIILGLIITSLYMVARSVQYFGCVSYQDMVISHAGHTAGTICKILIFTNNIGACIVVLVVLGDQFEMLMNMIVGGHFCQYWYMRRTFFVPATSALIILPFCLMKNFDFFKYISFLGFLAALYVGFGVGMIRAATGVAVAGQAAPKFNWISPISSQLVSVIPVICFAYECHVELPPMFACLKRQSMNYTMRLVIGYVLTSFLVYTVGGIGGYVALGDTVPGDFLLAYPSGDKLVIVAMALVSMKGLTTYPVIFYCVRTVIDDVWRNKIRKPELLTREPWRRSLQTVTIVSFTVIVAIFVPSISIAIGLLGGVSACFVFIFPGLCYMQMNLKHRSGSEIGVASGAAFVVLGFFLLGCTSVNAAYDLMSGGASEPTLC